MDWAACLPQSAAQQSKSTTQHASMPWQSMPTKVARRWLRLHRLRRWLAAHPLQLSSKLPQHPLTFHNSPRPLQEEAAAAQQHYLLSRPTLALLLRKGRPARCVLSTCKLAPDQ